MASKSKEQENINPLLHTDMYEDQALPTYLKVLAVLVLVAGVLGIPIYVRTIGKFFSEIAAGVISEQSSNTILLFSLFMVCMILSIAGAISAGILLLRNKRRTAAIVMTFLTAILVISIVIDVMLEGMKLEIFGLAAAAIIVHVINLKTDPSLRGEYKLQRKLKKMETKADAESGMLGRDKSGKGYAKMNYYNILWIFIVCCVIGYVVEIVWHMLVDDPGVYQERAGFLFGPFSPIYGLGGVLFCALCNKIHDKNIIVIFLVCAFAGSCFEYFASLFLEAAFGIRSWDYSHLPLNINGRISIRFFFMWGIFGTLFTKIAFKPLINGINKIPLKWRYGLTILLSVIIWTNAVMTLQALDCWYERSAGKEVVTPIDQFYATYFPDDYMQARFENMQMDPGNAVRLE